MTNDAEFDPWSAGQSSEHYMGRWSREVAGEYLEWPDRRKVPGGWRSVAGPAR